jgi:uncharacterized protein (TIGR02246 family)
MNGMIEKFSKRTARTAQMGTLVGAAMTLMSSLAMAGPAEDGNATVDRWSAAYSSNAPDAVVKTYWPDATLLGTVSPVMSEGTAGLEKYFARLKGSGNKNVIEERRTIVIDNSAVLITGFYLFTVMKEGQPTPTPARFTMLVTKRNGDWRIAHHHSSPRAMPK